MYEYANARIRALRGRLLPSAEVAALAGSPTLAELIGSLAGSDYAADLEEGRRSATGLALVEGAIRRNLARRSSNVLGFFGTERPGEMPAPRRLVTVLLARQDVANLVAVLRGQAAGVPPASTLEATIPAGLLTGAQLGALAETRDAPACLRLARGFGLSWTAAGAEATADPRLPDRARTANAIEPALRRGFIAWAIGQTRTAGANGRLVRDFLAVEADARNVVVALRLARAGARPGQSQLADLLAPGGALDAKRLANVARQPSLIRAVETLERTPFGRVLGATGVESLLVDQVVGLEWAVERFLARWARAQAFRDPLGIGVAVAYMTEKSVEARLLRLVARGVASRWPRERVEQLLAA